MARDRLPSPLVAGIEGMAERRCEAALRREFPPQAGAPARGGAAPGVVPSCGPPPGRPFAGKSGSGRVHGFSALRLRRDFGYIRALSGRGEAHLTAAILDAPRRRTGAYFRRPATSHRG